MQWPFEGPRPAERVRAVLLRPSDALGLPRRGVVIVAERPQMDAEFQILWEECAAKLPDPAWAKCNYLDGPGFVAWLERQEIKGLYKHSSTRRWQSGGEVSYAAADELLIKHGLLLSQVPERLWKEKP